jgi:hypothetical protein
MAADAYVIDMSDLKDLEPLAQRLKAAQDDLNQALQTIQDRLNALGIGVEVWLEEELDSTDWRSVSNTSREYTASQLGYGRVGDGWALLVRTRRIVETLDPSGGGYEDAITDTYDGNDSAKPLLRASRAVRANAVPLIPRLVEAIEREATKLIARVEEARKIADSLK